MGDFLNYVEFWSFKIFETIQMLSSGIPKKFKKGIVPNECYDWAVNAIIQMKKKL